MLGRLPPPEQEAPGFHWLEVGGQTGESDDEAGRV